MAILLRKERFNNGAIRFERTEVKFLLDNAGFPISAVLKISKQSNKLIEEFMLSANQAVARHLYKQKLPSIHRVHESPDEKKITDQRQQTSFFACLACQLT